MMEKLVGILWVASLTMIMPWTFLCTWFIVETAGRLLKRPAGPLVLRTSSVLDLVTPFFLFSMEGILIGIILYA